MYRHVMCNNYVRWTLTTDNRECEMSWRNASHSELNLIRARVLFSTNNDNIKLITIYQYGSCADIHEGPCEFYECHLKVSN